MTAKLSRFLSTKRPGFIVAIILIILIPLSSCSFPGDSKNFDPNSSSSETSLITIQFNLQLLSAPQEGERIGIEILDEVTGLPYNPRQYEMVKVDDLQYASPLSFPTGSVVKYRYIKIGDGIKTEASSNGESIRYRLLFVNRENTIIDFLQTWEGEPVQNTTGSLSGTLMDNENKQPIPDILVSAGGQLTFTDANGHFLIPGLSPGTHNVVFYALDGKYGTYQQGATISAGMNTPAQISLTPMPLVNVTFHVTAPTDAIGAPIYLAGNVIQLGNTFSDLAGGMSVKPKRLPKLTPQEDGTYIIDLQLYAQTDLRYKFTLGDGYWNAEQQSSGGFQVRQLIVPSQDVEVEVGIVSWRSGGVQPITFNVSVPSDNTPRDEKFIQFKTSQWTEPIPLWPLGGDNYLYILYSPMDTSLPISYRYCRNEDCESAHNTMTAEVSNVQPSETEQSINDSVTSWVNWSPINQQTDIQSTNIRAKDSNYQTSVELTPNMDPAWLIHAPQGLSELSENGVKNIIFSPQWQLQSNAPTLLPKIGQTPFYYELTQMLSFSQSLGLTTSLFPQLGPSTEIAAWWHSQSPNHQWWQNWFGSYEDLIINYAKIAEISGVSSLIMGGKAVLPAFPEGSFPDNRPTDVPESINERWQSLLSEIRGIYSGKLIWATNAHVDVDPLPSFIDLFDEIYISIDSPLAQDQNPTHDEIYDNFNNLIDSHIYEIYRSTLKPISIGLAYPSANGSAQGCYLVSDNCYHDGLFLPEETASLSVDLDEQSLIYEAVLHILASREWITGITIRGVNPTIALQDASSSILGKPAWMIIQSWFSGLNPVD